MRGKRTDEELVRTAVGRPPAIREKRLGRKRLSRGAPPELEEPVGAGDVERVVPIIPSGETGGKGGCAVGGTRGARAKRRETIGGALGKGVGTDPRVGKRHLGRHGGQIEDALGKRLGVRGNPDVADGAARAGKREIPRHAIMRRDLHTDQGRLRLITGGNGTWQPLRRPTDTDITIGLGDVPGGATPDRDKRPRDRLCHVIPRRHGGDGEGGLTPWRKRHGKEPRERAPILGEGEPRGRDAINGKGSVGKTDVPP